jgi:hypothetical protein
VAALIPLHVAVIAVPAATFVGAAVNAGLPAPALAMTYTCAAFGPKLSANVAPEVEIVRPSALTVMLPAALLSVNVAVC